MPTRLELVNCHDFDKRFEQALDAGECAIVLRSLVGTLPSHLQQCLLPLPEQERRNNRALVFVPQLHLRPGVTSATRAELIDSVRTSLSSGNYDRHGRRPRVRWEPGPHQKPLSRLMAQGHRLTEKVCAAHGELSSWKVQSAGKAVEVWHCPVGGRPTLFIRFDESLVLSFVAENLGPVTADHARGWWREVTSS